MTDLDADLAALYPQPAPDAAALRRARTRVLKAVEAEPVVAPARTGVRRWPRIAIAAAVTAVLLSLTAVTLINRENPQPGAMVEVAQTLDTAADRQIRTFDPPIRAGQFRYLATHALSMTYTDTETVSFAVRMGTRTETWIPADPNAVWTGRETDTGERAWLVGTPEQARAAGVPDTVAAPVELHGRCGAWYAQPGEDPCAAPGNWQTPTDRFTDKLSRNPRKLLKRLRADTAGRGNDRDQEVLVYVADVLRSGIIPADLRAALYRALALLPTLTITERTTTLDGHHGTALGIAAAGKLQEVIIDPATGDFIGERTRLTAARDGIATGTLIGSSSTVYAITQQVGERPTR